MALLRDVFGSELVGAYLHGSATLGGLRPRSDVDVLAVTRRPATREQKRRLVDGLLPISGRSAPGSPSPIELTLVVQADVRPWRFPPRRDFQYGEWLRGEFASGADEPWEAVPDADLAVLLTMALRADRALAGPPPADVLDPVPHEDVLRTAPLATAAVLRDLDGDTRNVLLTLARVWCTVATGEIRAKDAAADWALERLPSEHREVLAAARASYLGGTEPRWEELAPRVRAHADHVAAEIRGH